MSKRHRSDEMAPPPKADVRAHARAERHRVHSELNSMADVVSSGVEPDDVVEPGPEFKPDHRRDADRALRKRGRARLRHWKVKAWKRRSTTRKQRAVAVRRLAEET
jgi:hypothetical protein